MKMISVAALATQRALAAREFPCYVALTQQLPQIAVTVSEGVCRNSRRVFRISNLLC